MQDHGGGVRVWVPIISMGWDWAGFYPPALPRELEICRAGGAVVGGKPSDLKWVPDLR